MARPDLGPTASTWFGKMLAPAAVISLVGGGVTVGINISESRLETRVAIMDPEVSITQAEARRERAALERSLQLIAGSLVPRAEYTATVDRLSADVSEIKREIEQLGIEIRSQRR